MITDHLGWNLGYWKLKMETQFPISVSYLAVHEFMNS